MYRYARGHQDPQTSLEYIKSSAQLGYPPAQNHLALMYKSHGAQAKPDEKKSLWWLHQAAEKDYLPAIEELIAWYADRPRQQEYWVAKLDKLNETARATAQARLLVGPNTAPAQQFELGNQYEQGIYPMVQDIEQAEYWYKQAGYPRASPSPSSGWARFITRNVSRKKMTTKKQLTGMSAPPIMAMSPRSIGSGEIYYNGIGTVESKLHGLICITRCIKFMVTIRKKLTK